MTRPPLSLLLLALPAFCSADTVTILGGGAQSDTASSILGSGDFTGDTTVELSFVGSVGGQVDKAITTSLYELIAGVESIVSDSIGAEEAGRVSLPEGAKPRVKIITEIGRWCIDVCLSAVEIISTSHALNCNRMPQ